MNCTDYRIVVNQGASFSLGLTVLDLNKVAINITGFTFQSQIRSAPGGEIIGEFTFTITSGVNGQVTMSMSAEDTTDLEPGDYYYDVKMTQTDLRIFRIFQGPCVVSAQITQDEEP